MRRRNETRWKVLLVGVAIAIAPMLGLNLLLWFHVQTHGGENIRAAADSMISLVDARLDDAMTALETLGMRNAHGCSADQLERIGRATQATQFISEIAIVDQTGVPICTSNGRPREVHRLAPDKPTKNPNIKLSVVDAGLGSDIKTVRLIWRFRDGWGFSALVPGDRLIPEVMVGRLQANFLARLTLDGGALIAAKATSPDLVILEGDTDTPPLATRATSQRYPFTLTVVAPRSALWSSYRDLFLYGNLGGVLLGAFIMCGAFIIARQMEGAERHIEKSIRRGEFIPYYQPVIDIQSGRLVGCEVLVRRRRPNGKIEPPGVFIALAEATGQIFGITHAVMLKARDELETAYALRPRLKIAFNLTAGHFDNFGIVREVEQIFSPSLIRMSQLTFEVTERDPLPNIARARVVIAKLQELGARVALDDVGTGHGGLSYLLKLGVNEMKMDKMFIDAISTNTYSATIVDTLIRLADELGMDLVAEGVETYEQVQYLQARGVCAAQGYVFSPPLPLSSFLALIEAMEPLRTELVPLAEEEVEESGETRAA